MRVTGGELAGRKLGNPPDGVRPTSDRVRESLFARLGSLEGARVLDLYAGTGSLGIESLSRGAEVVVFVDKSGRSLAGLRGNLKRLELMDRCEVLRGEGVAMARRLSGQDRRFDLVLLDPPYASDEVARALAEIAEGRLLAEGGQVVVESPKRHPVDPVDGLVVLDERRYGDTLLTRLGLDDRSEDEDREPTQNQDAEEALPDEH